MTDDPNIIVLTDEDGNEEEFRHLETIEYDGDVYVALEPVSRTEEEILNDIDDYVILQVVIDEDGEESLVSIEDEELLDELANEFESLFEDDDNYYTVTDDDEDDENDDFDEIDEDEDEENEGK